MSNPTSNFNWQMPTATDLVTDLPADFEVFGQAVDTAMADLLGGTTGQILAKNSNTNMDFVWVAPTTGDITGVTAGTGISGGGTSGDVTITNDMATTITASGDIIVGTGSGTYDNLPIGTTGQILTADTTVSPYKVKWATPAGGGGKVLQVVFASTGTNTANSTTTYADTTLTATITPTLNTSKVLVIVNQNGCGHGAVNTNEWIRIMRGATEILEISDLIGYTNTTTTMFGLSVGATYLDSPATTSATTYKTQFRSENTDTVRVQGNNNGTCNSTITLLEIGA